MSAAAAVAAAEVVLPGQRSGRGRLRSVPAQAGPVPVPVSGPGHPLALGRRTRVRLRGAVRRLLADPALAGAPDAVRLAAVVLAAKTWEKSGWSEITTRELGRWIGLSQSRTASGVLPVLRGSGMARTQVRTLPGSEKVLGLRCAVVPLWAGRGVAGDELALTRGELATLLRLVEACFAPGWRTKGEDWSTAPGLLGTGSGPTAASDRLALLLLVLECGSQGRVKLCGGRADERHGRSATTLARLMSCTPSRAARILARLEEQGLVDRRRVKTASGLHHRARLLVPAVAAAHGAAVRADVEEQAQEQAVVAAEAAIADPAPAAGVGEPPSDDVSAQVTVLDVAAGAEVADPAPAAHLHTDHSFVADVVDDSRAVDGFSGGAVVGAGRLRPERADVREDAAVQAGDGPRLTVVEDEGGPLRGEQPTTERRGGTAGRKTAGQERGVAQVPLDLAVALSPVIGLWWRVKRRGERAVIVAAARAELAAVAERTDPTSAPGLLAERLAFRLGRQGAVDSVRDPVGWLLRRGLPQGRQCGDVRCDDGILLTDGSACPRCEDNRTCRRRERQQVTEDINRQLPHVTAAQRRGAVEQRMRDLAQLAAEGARVRGECERRLVVERRAFAERERLQAAQDERVRLAVPCSDCGAPAAAGLCGACEDGRGRQRAVELAVRTRVAGWADPGDPARVSEVEALARRQVQAHLGAVLEAAAAAGALPVTLAALGRVTAESLAEDYRRRALEELGAGAVARAEGRLAHDAQMRDAHRHPTPEMARLAADGAAARARTRAAEQLLTDRLADCPGLVSAAVGSLAATDEPDHYRLGAARVRAALRVGGGVR